MDIIIETKKSVNLSLEATSDATPDAHVDRVTDLLTRWGMRKKDVDAIANSLKTVDSPDEFWEKLSVDMFNCATFLEFVHCADKSKLKYANFCRRRPCYMCAWRKSVEHRNQIFNLSKIIFSENRSYRPLLVTLTVPNCSAENLRETVKRLNKSFAKMIKRDFWKKAIKACFRSIEVTYSKERGDYHPHIHALVVVSKDYFEKKHNFYIERDDLLAHWQDCFGDSSITQVDMRTVRKKNGPDNTIWGAVAEVCKYSTKPSDIIVKKGKAVDVSVEPFMVLAESLKGIHLIQYYGLFKKIRLDCKRNGEVFVDDSCSGCDNCKTTKYCWHATQSAYNKIDVLN